MKSSPNLNWLTHQPKDEVYAFNKIIQEEVEFESVATFRGYIEQHAKYFFSPLNQIYLFLIKDIASLVFFDKVFVRDGLLTLKLFFLRNPTPNGLQTKLIINSRFQKFIPAPWKDNVYFYNYKLESLLSNNKNKLIISYHIDTLHCPDEVLEKYLRSIDTEKYDEVLCLITGMPQRWPTDYIDKNIFSKSAIMAKNIKTKYRVVTLDDLNPGIIANSNYLEINLFHYLFSDCYIRWFLINNGATPIDNNWLMNESKNITIHKVMMSPYHSVEIQAQQSIQSSYEPTIDELDFFSTDITPGRDQNINLCSEGFKRYVQSLIIQHAKFCN